MAGSISNFLSTFKEDAARPSRFDVEIPVPLKLVSYRNAAQKLTLRCDQAQFPSRSLMTTERKIYGPSELQPYNSSYNQLELQFIVSGDMMEKKFFDAWLDLINPRSTFNLAYKNDYISDITINQYDLQNELTYSINLINAFPISINELDLDWSNEYSFHKLTVVFSYHYWERSGIQGIAADFFNAGISSAVDFGTNLLNSTFSGNQAECNGTPYDISQIATKID